MTMHVRTALKTTEPSWPRMAMLAAAIALASSARDSACANELRDITARLPQSQLFVTNCDDGGAGSLRDTIASATSGDMIDLSELTCSTITLTSGAIEIPQDDLYIKYSGEGGTPPTIDGNFSSRVFDHTGAGTLKLVGLTIQNGKYDNHYAPYPTLARGGCVYSTANVYLLGSTITHCTAKDEHGRGASGGGVDAQGSVTLAHSTVSSATAYSAGAAAAGGGVLTHGAAYVEYSSISGNIATSTIAGRSAGGGLTVINLGTAVSTLTSSTIDGNAADKGGGLFVGGGGPYTAAVSIVDSTISGNTGNVYAAAAYLDGPVTIVASTIAFNTSNISTGVELASASSPVQIESSIVADDANAYFDYDIGGRGYAITITGSHDIVIHAAQGIVLPADTINAEPLLLPLADNGGETRTHALGDGSPALDAGDDVAALRFDQRGNPFLRVIGAAADIGAYEQQSASDIVFTNGFDP